ncbi:MAG: nuclear transport factor 2 family protein [Panacagrimonas sp.]
MSQANVEQVQEVFARFGRGDVPAILEMLDENVIIDFYGPPTIPYAGHYETKAEARKFFETVLASVNINQFDQHEFIAERDKVVVFGHLNLTAKSTGGTIDSDYVHVITVRDGLWHQFRDFMNTAVGVEAFTPRQA